MRWSAVGLTVLVLHVSTASLHAQSVLQGSRGSVQLTARAVGFAPITFLTRASLAAFGELHMSDGLRRFAGIALTRRP